MDAITLKTIRAAQSNDLHAVTEVIKATESRVRGIAARMSVSHDQREEFEQVGRVAIWEALDRFTGESVDSFYAFMTRTVETTIRDAARIEKNQGATGADHTALWTFAACVREAKGDLDAAQILCQTLPPKGRRLSADRAAAARMAYEGPVSLDMRTGEEESTLADFLESDYGVPGELVEPGDINRSQRDRKIRTVRAVLDSMGAKGSYILKATYGITPSPCLGTGAAADAEIAAAIGSATSAIKVMRNQAHKSFESRYRKAVGASANGSLPC
ncbi:sigma factor [Streptomyces tsukubensis]|uniref:sigma factor n=1 Tax=Streptomyces tsukubensis TaxID=83656 RepID=UPI00344C42F7